MLLWAILVALFLGFVLVALAVPATLGVRQRLDDGRQAMQQARTAVVAGDERQALGRFRAAKVSFDEAAAQSSSGVLGVAHGLPIIGPNIDVVGALARAGSRTAAAGIEVANAVGRLPGGVEALAPTNGRIPLGAFAPLAEAIGRAHGLVRAAAAEVRTSAASGLLPPIQDARIQATSSLDDLVTTLGAAAGMLDGLPAFLGADGTRTYLFGAENPAELRGTGGLIGAYALLRASDGRLSFSPFRPVQSLPLLDPTDLPAPNEDYRRLYDPQRTGNGFWLNANMTPDFPSAAQALEAGFRAATGREIDGVVTADPFALRALLESTGPAQVPGLGVRVTADSVVPFLANQAYARIKNPAERKLVLGAVAETVVGRFLEAGGATRSVRAVGRAAGEGHIKLYSNDPALEAAFAVTGAGGAFGPVAGAGDLLSVVVNNGAGNKVDYYVDRSVGYDVTLNGDGSATAETQVRLANHAPTGGLPAYVLGPSHGVTDRAGQDVSILNVYCGRCDVTDVTRDGKAIDPGRDHELGSNFGQAYLTIDPGATTTTRFAYDLTDTWAAEPGGGGTYTLRFLNQPTIRPTDLRIAVHLPEGMHVTDSSPGVEVDGPVARWSGVPGRTLVFQVSFAPPLPERLWRSLVS